MKISVVVPIYNSENTLKKCVESICNQIYNNLEIILINDGSTDHSLDICNEFKEKDSRIIVVNNTNHGVSYSRNEGIKLATGDFVTFVDSDDYIDKECYNELVNYLSDDLDFLRYNFRSNINLKNDLYDLKDKEIILDKSNLLNVYSHFLTFDEAIHCFSVLLLIKTSLAKKICFDEKLTILEDMDFYVKLFNVSKKALFCDKKFYYYFINKNSVTQDASKSSKNIFGIINSNVLIKKKLNVSSSELLLKKVDANHLRLICKYLINLYIYDKNNYKEIIVSLKTNDVFVRMLSNYKYCQKKNKLLLFFIKNNLKFFEYLYLDLIKNKRR